MRFLLLPCLLLSALTACGAPARSSADAADPMAELEADLAARGIYPEHRPTRVTLYDVRSGVKIGLLNEATADKSDYYSKTRADSSYKVVPDLDMGALLAALEQIGYWSYSEPVAGRVRGASVMLQVERGDATDTLAYNERDSKDKIRCAVDCKEAIRAFYDAHTSYQAVENDRGVLMFLDSLEEARRSGGRAKG